jgi:UDP-N-acetylmuramate dehydrogenase
VDILENVPLKEHTTLKVGGPARYFVVAKTKEDTIEAHQFVIEKGLPVFFLGGGSNILASDKGFEGVVIKIETKDIYMCDQNQICADAGVLMSDLLRFSLGNGLQGVEWAAGLPGTIGAAIYGNSGCNGGCTADIVERVWYHDGYREVGEKLTESDFGYRYSKFKSYPAMITRVEFKKLPFADDIDAIQEKINELNKRRSESQPKGTTIGCIFKNPILSNGEMISAGLAIDLAGYKDVCFPSRSVADSYAKISEKHGNFFLNVNGAKAFHFWTLITTAKACVRHRSKQIIEELNKRDGKKRDTGQVIELEEEITYLGDFDFRGSSSKAEDEQEGLRRDNIGGCSDLKRPSFDRGKSSRK